VCRAGVPITRFSAHLQNSDIFLAVPSAERDGVRGRLVKAYGENLR
jgi:hypothetical protein